MNTRTQLINQIEQRDQSELLEKAKAHYSDFLDLCKSADGTHSLTPASDPSAFATCFWVFGMRLIRKDANLAESRIELSRSIRDAVREARSSHANKGLLYGKAYRQLLAFSLSALSILGSLEDDPLGDLVVEQLPQSVERELERFKCLEGKAQSGNQAMFMAIFLLHSRDNLGLDVDDQLHTWVRCHLDSMNRFGFWGNNQSRISLQFQNGYHQYEILEYLGVHSGKTEAAAGFVARLADARGHFAPYPGGGGCFDYDAVFMLTPGGGIPNLSTAELLRRTTATLLSEQQSDGGFCESLYVRPRSAMNVVRSIGHVWNAVPCPSAVLERFRYALALQRRKYDRIQTHWSSYSRRWDESDLWDSWFRMLALARIECAMDQQAAAKWGFIDYPGIGFHPSLRSGA